jgi:fimbrial chaperone protein
MGKCLDYRMRSLLLLGVLTLASLLLTLSAASAGEFRVTPIRLDFSRAVKSGVLTVINEGKEKITLQISVMEWTQDEQGKDVYTPTSDVVFYPKVMTLESAEQQVIRAGSKGAPPPREKTYRLFIEEIPVQQKAEEGRSQVNIVIRFAPPIFIRPDSEKIAVSLTEAGLVKGVFKLGVNNSGNIHVTITSVLMRGMGSDGQAVFTKEISGWYLLNGASRTYETTIPSEACQAMQTVEVELKTETLTLNRVVHVLPEMCSQ